MIRRCALDRPLVIISVIPCGDAFNCTGVSGKCVSANNFRAIQVTCLPSHEFVNAVCGWLKSNMSETKVAREFVYSFGFDCFEIDCWCGNGRWFRCMFGRNNL